MFMMPVELYKLKKTPSGRGLWTYMAAILHVTEMDKGKSFPLKKFLGNFKTHTDNGRIAKVAGGYQLTDIGIDYFNDRFSIGSRQHIDKAEVDIMIIGITKGMGSEEWLKIL
jgi:hypothetical protein